MSALTDLSQRRVRSEGRIMLSAGVGAGAGRAGAGLSEAARARARSARAQRQQEAEAALAACRVQRANTSVLLQVCSWEGMVGGSSSLSPPFGWPGMVWDKNQSFEGHKGKKKIELG